MSYWNPEWGDKPPEGTYVIDLQAWEEEANRLKGINEQLGLLVEAHSQDVVELRAEIETLREIEMRCLEHLSKYTSIRLHEWNDIVRKANGD